jgi:hypothetical protein
MFIDLKTDTGSSVTACGAVRCDSTKSPNKCNQQNVREICLKKHVIRNDSCLFAALYRRWILVNLSETNP